jgi:hypothetical protein
MNKYLLTLSFLVASIVVHSQSTMYFNKQIDLFNSQCIAVSVVIKDSSYYITGVANKSGGLVPYILNLDLSGLIDTVTVCQF